MWLKRKNNRFNAYRAKKKPSLTKYQKYTLSKISKEHIKSIFQNYKLENKLLQKLGLGMDIIM